MQILIISCEFRKYFAIFDHFSKKNNIFDTIFDFELIINLICHLCNIFLASVCLKACYSFLLLIQLIWTRCYMIYVAKIFYLLQFLQYWAKLFCIISVCISCACVISLKQPKSMQPFLFTLFLKQLCYLYQCWALSFQFFAIVWAVLLNRLNPLDKNKFVNWIF